MPAVLQYCTMETASTAAVLGFGDNVRSIETSRF